MEVIGGLGDALDALTGGKRQCGAGSASPPSAVCGQAVQKAMTEQLQIESSNKVAASAAAGPMASAAAVAVASEDPVARAVESLRSELKALQAAHDELQQDHAKLIEILRLHAKKVKKELPEVAPKIDSKKLVLLKATLGNVDPLKPAITYLADVDGQENVFHVFKNNTGVQLLQGGTYQVTASLAVSGQFRDSRAELDNTVSRDSHVAWGIQYNDRFVAKVHNAVPHHIVDVSTTTAVVLVKERGVISVVIEAGYNTGQFGDITILRLD